MQLALDDFGSGYSSLAYLQQLPFDKLKIDRGFVAALDQSANTGVIIQAIVTLGRALGMSVLIEGVETEEQRVLLRLAGCNEMQGFLFAQAGARARRSTGCWRRAACCLPVAAMAAAGWIGQWPSHASGRLGRWLRSTEAQVLGVSEGIT